MTSYTDGFRIPTAGISFAGMALHNPTNGTATAIVVPFRQTGGATLPVALQAGQVLELRFREVKSAGVTLVGLY
jgi:hypothetical protein